MLGESEHVLVLGGTKGLAWEFFMPQNILNMYMCVLSFEMFRATSVRKTAEGPALMKFTV